MSDGMMQLHSSVGTGAGCIPDGERMVPVITLHFAKTPDTLRMMENELAEFDPTDNELWHNFALSIRGARQLIGDLQGMVDAAIQGPPT